MPIDPLPLAAVRYRPRDSVDLLLAAAVDRLRADGLRVAGALQAEERDADGCCGPMRLRSLDDGSEVVISQNLGRMAQGCRLDPQALAAAAVTLAASLDALPDILVLNRFGKAEAEGGGLRSVMERAVELGIPLVLAVRDDHASAWAAFHGGFAVDLDGDVEAVLAWCRRVAAPRRAA